MPFIPVIAEAFAVVGTFLTTTAIGSTLLAAGIGLAASYAVNLLTPKTDSSSQTSTGVNFTREYGNDVSRKVACGRVAMAGHDTYVNTYSESNQRLEQIYTFSDFYATSLTRVAVDGVWCNVGPTTGSEGQGLEITGAGDRDGWLFIKFMDGRQTTVDGILATNANGRVWSGIGAGISGVVAWALYNKDKDASFPDFFFEFQGAPLYDWRKDSSVGGSGSHRWSDQTTWEFSENPVVMSYNYRRGFFWNGTDCFCGMGMDAADLPLDKWTVAANLCDEADETDGQPRYRASVIFDCNATHASNLTPLSVACNATDIDGIDGTWMLVGSAQTVVATFTDEDIVRTTDFKYQRLQSQSSLVNSVSGTYPAVDQLWSMVPYDTQQISDRLTRDRRTRDITLDLAMVYWGRQANQLAAIALSENRYECTATITLRPRFMGLESGDWVTWNSVRYGTMTFIIKQKTLVSLDDPDKPRCITLELQQRDAAIYMGARAPTLPTYIYPGAPDYAAEVIGLSALPVTVQGADGRLAPAIRVSWTLPADATITGVEVIYYPQLQPTSVMSQIVDATRSVVMLLNGVLANTLYTVQTRIITNPSRTTAFDVGVGLTTDNVGITLIDLGPEIQAEITTINSSNNARLNQLEADLATYISNQDARNWIDKKNVRSQQMSLYGNSQASITNLSTTQAASDAAFASFQQTINATIGDNFSTVDTISSAVATIDGTLSAQWKLTLDVNNHIVGINSINGGDIGSITFVYDKFTIALPSASGGSTKPVFTLATVDGVTSLALGANLIADGYIKANHLAVTTLSAVSGDMGSLTAGRIASPSGRFIIDANNERLEIWA